jgi:hypothetical protein
MQVLRSVHAGEVIRDMKCIQRSVQQLRPEDWRAAVLELDHAY